MFNVEDWTNRKTKPTLEEGLLGTWEFGFLQKNLNLREEDKETFINTILNIRDNIVKSYAKLYNYDENKKNYICEYADDNVWRYYVRPFTIYVSNTTAVESHTKDILIKAMRGDYEYE